MFYTKKIKNQLFIKKNYNEDCEYENFIREKQIYEILNDFHVFVHYYGYILNKNNSVASIVIEFMSNKTLLEFIDEKKYIKKAPKMKSRE